MNRIFIFTLADMPTYDDNDDDNHNESNVEHNQNVDGDQPKAPVKKKRMRKQLSTVTKNKDTLNANLDLIQLPDALYYKLNSIMGETSSSNKLLLNTLQTKTSDLSLTMDDKFWDSKTYEPIEFDPNDNYESSETVYTELPLKFNTDPRKTLRQSMSGYIISNTPPNDVEE